MQCSLFSVLGILSFLSFLAFSQSKQSLTKDGKLRLQPKLKPLLQKRGNQGLVNPGEDSEYPGLPGEPEYEIDTSDQQKAKEKEKNGAKSDETFMEHNVL